MQVDISLLRFAGGIIFFPSLRRVIRFAFTGEERIRFFVMIVVRVAMSFMIVVPMAVSMPMVVSVIATLRPLPQ